VQFVTQDGKQSRPFYFFQHNDIPASYTWQVERAEFDMMLMENARKHGVTVREQVKVQRFLQNQHGRVTGVFAEDVEGRTAELHATVTIDCTGRDALWASKQNLRQRDPKLKKIALWTYYKGAKRDPGLDAGSTTVAYIPNKGWFWYIPLKNDITSVGIVAERDYIYRDKEMRELPDIFEREIGENVWIQDHLAQGQQFGQYWVTGEYSYRASHCATDALVMAGDAFAFLDPVFSSGVFLALKSGEMAANAVDAALSAGDVSASSFDAYGTELCKHVETMRKIVYSFYDENFSFGKLVSAFPHLRGRLTDCLIGDTKQDFTELFEAISTIADLPEELSYGKTGQKLAAAVAV
jgi:flavin-dependent dehydrogenase